MQPVVTLGSNVVSCSPLRQKSETFTAVWVCLATRPKRRLGKDPAQPWPCGGRTLIDFQNPENNDFLVVRQTYDRRSK
jgi:hypothetical protein